MTTIAELKALDAAATPGKWEWWTSNSLRRLRSHVNIGHTLPVAEAIQCRDGVPDISISPEDMALIVELHNAFPAVIAALEEIHSVSTAPGEASYTSAIERLNRVASIVLALGVKS